MVDKSLDFFKDFCHTLNIASLLQVGRMHYPFYYFFLHYFGHPVSFRKFILSYNFSCFARFFVEQ